ncbi:WecB/TagA/CpsF family glycosyltransferase [Bradyrhizobium sp. 40]|uniref:WecB/TagA/CpsF family glycosyltransferase n=1 Tax=Bradyrhizobium sp. 40 TaxID=2782674 RepID=UPI001FFF5C1D|nr:WecB/TagA/CpsF family glycosyltransferase [Bradyrhizobium sp. 40]UPJ41134.1 WecB/TagA/CpsF family glycosyltransferase [Bradyrhizobium sp. 40]
MKQILRIVHLIDSTALPDTYVDKIRKLVESQLRAGDDVKIISAEESGSSLSGYLCGADLCHLHGGVGFLLRMVREISPRKIRLVATLLPGLKNDAQSQSALSRIRRIAKHIGYVFMDGSADELELRKYGVQPLKSSDVYSAQEVADIGMAYRCVVGQKWRAILGIRTMVASQLEAIEILDSAVRKRTSLRLTGLNVNLAQKSLRNRDLFQALRSSLLFNDGVGVDIASKLLYGFPYVENLNGTDLYPAYLDRSVHSLRIYLVCSRRELAERVLEVFKARWPRHDFVGWHDGYADKRNPDEIAASIARLQPDIVMIGMGNPRQELWMAENIPAVAPVGICVGGLFDFIAGEVERAPTWVRNIRMEWAFRLMLEPQRLWRRYMVESWFFFIEVFRQYVSGARA